jgi:hypothetical protein
MVRRLPYRLIYDTEISRQLRSIERKYHALIRANIEDQLTYEPGVETNNRKPLERPVMGERGGSCVSGRTTIFGSTAKYVSLSARCISWRLG